MISTVACAPVRKISYRQSDDVDTSPVSMGFAIPAYARLSKGTRFLNIESSVAVLLSYESDSRLDDVVTTVTRAWNPKGVWLYGEAVVAKTVSKYDAVVKGLLGRGPVVVTDSESTTASPRIDAVRHVHNLKQYEASISRSKALDYMFEVVEEAFAQSDVEMLNCLLYTAARELKGTTLSVSLLRATFRARSELSMWKPLRDVTQNALSGHVDGKKLLRGLLG